MNITGIRVKPLYGEESNLDNVTASPGQLLFTVNNFDTNTGGRVYFDYPLGSGQSLRMALGADYAYKDNLKQSLTNYVYSFEQPDNYSIKVKSGIGGVKQTLALPHVGGRNLLKNSKSFKAPWSTGEKYIAGQADVWGETNAVSVSGASTVLSYSPTNLALFKPGKYVFSCWIKASANQTITISAANGSEVLTKKQSITTSWQKIEWAFETTKTQIANNAIISIKNSSSSTITFQLCYPQLEKGTIATDWRPSIEDVDNSYGIVQTKLNTTTKAYLTGTTSATDAVGDLIFDTGVYLGTKAGSLYATEFHGKLVGTADKALQNSLGGNLVDAIYSVAQDATDGHKLVFTHGDGAKDNITIPDNDYRVKNELKKTTKAYVTGTTSAKTSIGTQIFDTGVYLGTTEGTLYATTFHGNLSGNATSATKAVNDDLSQRIDSYLRTVSISGNTLTFTTGKGDSSTTINVPNNYVSQSVTSTDKYRPILMGYTSDADASKLGASATNVAYVSTKFYCKPDTGDLYATTFHGALSGKATSAATADSVAWANVTGKPVNFVSDISYNASGHTDALRAVDATGKQIFSQPLAPLVNGVIPIKYIPKAAIERIHVVETKAKADSLLTAGTVQAGDVIKVTATGLMYFVSDSNTLIEFTVGSAAHASTADSATKATKDGNGNIITTHYMKYGLTLNDDKTKVTYENGKGEKTTIDYNFYPYSWTWANGTTSGPTATIGMKGIANISVGAIPAASSSVSGIVTTGAQTFIGAKTFNSAVLMKNKLTVENGQDAIYTNANTHTEGDIQTVGGITVGKNLRVDGGANSAYIQMHKQAKIEYDGTKDCFNFVFN